MHYTAVINLIDLPLAQTRLTLKISPNPSSFSTISKRNGHKRTATKSTPLLKVAKVVGLLDVHEDNKKVNVVPHSIHEYALRGPEVIVVLGSQPAGDRLKPINPAVRKLAGASLPTAPAVILNTKLGDRGTCERLA